MLILRIRQAQVALADSRLDEAYQLACATDVRTHRRGQTLIGELARALVKRGQEHLEAQRLALALAEPRKVRAGLALKERVISKRRRHRASLALSSVSPRTSRA